VTEQIKGIKFSPKLIDGKATPSSLHFLAKFYSSNVYARGEYGLSRGGKIELTIESDWSTIWNGNVDLRDHSLFID